MKEADTSCRHVVLIPSYNSGPMLIEVVRRALQHWPYVWVVIDASTDRSEAALSELSRKVSGLRVIVLPENRGKGGASLEGMRLALDEGFTHVVLMDSDGQHLAENIGDFVDASRKNPSAMILGAPVFDASAPPERVKGRRIGNWWANVETLWGGVRDSLFGFRAYPLKDAVAVMESIRTARRFDFDTELVVRLWWRGLRPINIEVPVRYPKREEGGVTHFRYLRDNVLLARAHARLFLGMLARFPRLLSLRLRS